MAFQKQLLHGLLMVGSSLSGILGTLAFLFAGYGLLALPLGALVQATLALLGEVLAFRFLLKGRPSAGALCGWSGARFPNC